MSKQHVDVCFNFGGGEHAHKPKFGYIQWKKNFTRHFARFNFSRLSLAFILKYYPIFHACGEKIIWLASKNSVKLDKKSASDFLSLWHTSGDPFPVDTLHMFRSVAIPFYVTVCTVDKMNAGTQSQVFIKLIGDIYFRELKLKTGFNRKW